MEMRLQRLEETYSRIEALMTSLDDRMRHVEIEVAELKGRITNLPSTWAMITTVLGSQIAFAAVFIAIFRLTMPH